MSERSNRSLLHLRHLYSSLQDILMYNKMVNEKEEMVKKSVL